MGKGHSFTIPVSVQLDGSGNGTVSVGPLSAREVWHVLTASVSVNTNTTEADCSVYVGDAAEQRNLRATTFTGSSGDTTGQVAGDVKVGSKVWAVWTGGDPLATATLLLTGTKDV